LRQRGFKVARKFFNEALKLAKEVKNINWGAVSLRGIGEVLQNEQQYDSASSYYARSLESSVSIDDKKGISEVYYLYAKLAQLRNNSVAAIDYLQKGHAVAKRLGDRHQLLDNLDLFAIIYRSINNKEEVIQFQALYMDLRDSLFHDVVTRNLLLIPIKLKEEEDRIRLSTQRAEIERKNFTNKLFIVLIIIAGPLIILLFVLLRKIRNVNQLQKETLKEIAFVEAHQLRGPISSLLGLVNLLEDKIENPNNFKMYLEKIKGLSIKIDTVIKTIVKKTSTNHEQTTTIKEGGKFR